MFIIVIALLFIGLFFFAKPGQNGSSAIKASNIPDSSQELANSHTAGIGNVLTVPETFYDFGTISMKNGNVSKIFTISNPTEKDINLEKLTTSCMCTTAYFVQPDGSKKGPFSMPGMGIVPKLNKTIKAGEVASVEVIYDPNAHGPAGVGMIERSVFLEDENGTVVEFKFRANVTP